MAFDREDLLKKLTFALAMNPSITMTELAKQTEISKASLHRIYSTKENLQEIILQKVQEVYSDINNILTKEHKNFMADLKNLIAAFYENRNYILFIFRDVFTECIDSKNWEQHDANLNNFFLEGQKQNLISKNFPAEVIANIFSGSITWLLHMQAEKNNLSEDELKNFIFETFLNGVGEKK